ncbi:MAG: hypothetical protein V1857_07035 [archaeon]
MSKDDAATRELAEMKAYLEKRAAQLQEELNLIGSMGKLVDSALVDRSFKKVELPPSTSKVPAPPPTSEVVEPNIVSVTTEGGIHLADMEITEEGFALTPSSGLNFDVDSPPFRSFLIGRVLEPMKTKDNQSVQAGEISPEEALSYELEQDGNSLRRLIVTNCGDEKRLQELKNAIRWTLRRLYENIRA